MFGAARAPGLLGLAVLALVGVGHADDLTVAADGSGSFRTIQAAIDAAAEGSVIRVAAGTYVERLRIAKPVTISGAGADRTTVESPWKPDWLPPEQRRAKFERDMGNARNDAERRALAAAFRDRPSTNPVVEVVGARGVVLRGLRLREPGTWDKGGLSTGAIVEIRGGSARIEACVLVDSPASGIEVRAGGSAEVDRCLLAALGNTGVTVGERGAGPAAARVVACEIRGCRYAGIVIGAGCDDVLVEGCRISGASWHGIRYDDASPIVRDNRIFGNERAGIYASGTTAASVTGNLFERNELSGIACWLRNRDRIARNTFTGQARESIAILGASAPIVEGNVVVRSPAGVVWGDVGDEGPDRATNGAGVVRDNVFFEVEKVSTRELPADAGNRVGDPGLDADLRAAAGSRAGAASFPGAEPLWPPQPEEKEKRIAAAAAPPAEPPPVAPAAPARKAENPYDVAKPWIEAITQIADTNRRSAALDDVRAALKAQDPARNHAGLIAITQTAVVTYDRASFRGLIVPLAQGAQGEVRVAAFYALYNCDRKPEDRAILLAAVRDPAPEFASRASHLLLLFFDGVIEGEAAQAILKLLGAKDTRALREVLRGLWGARVAPEVEARLLELWKSEDRELKGAVNYFALSTLASKSAAVCDALFEAAQSADGELSRRALWGLGHGVGQEQHGRVAAFALDLFAAREADYLRSSCLELAGRYAGADQLVALDGIASNQALSAALRQKAQSIADAVRRR